MTAILVFFLDWLTKRLIWFYIPPPDPGFAISSSQQIPLFSCFGIDAYLTHAANTGAAWGIFAEDPHILLVVRLILIAALTCFALFFNRKASWMIPFGLIVSGACGNVIDSFTYGYVIDMIRVVFWGWDYPIFNVADSAIFIGTIWIFLSSLRTHNIAGDSESKSS